MERMKTMRLLVLCSVFHACLSASRRAGLAEAGKIGEKSFQHAQQEEQAEEPPSRGEDLILVMGMIRSGSDALHEFFACNGISSAHYCCRGSRRARFPCESPSQTCGACVHANLNGTRPAFHRCGPYAVYSQWDVETSAPFAWFLPQHYALPLLHESYPTSVWILNSRESPERWADSVLHWYSVTSRILHSFGESYHGNRDGASVGLDREVTVEALTGELEASVERAMDASAHDRRRRVLIDIYLRHEAKVYDFASEHGHSLLVLDVDDPRAGETLRGFFKDVDLRADCWKFDGGALDDDWKDFGLHAKQR
jgi:hypothetical protein